MQGDAVNHSARQVQAGQFLAGRCVPALDESIGIRSRVDHGAVRMEEELIDALAGLNGSPGNRCWLIAAQIPAMNLTAAGADGHVVAIRGEGQTDSAVGRRAGCQLDQFCRVQKLETGLAAGYVDHAHRRPQERRGQILARCEIFPVGAKSQTVSVKGFSQDGLLTHIDASQKRGGLGTQIDQVACRDFQSRRLGNVLESRPGPAERFLAAPLAHLIQETEIALGVSVFLGRLAGVLFMLGHLLGMFLPPGRFRQAPFIPQPGRQGNEQEQAG